MKYLETCCTDPHYNLAFEEWVLTHLCDTDYLILWQNDNSIIIGQNQNTLEEIDPQFVREHGIHVVRRTTGGGAVYHDLGNLNYSFITDYQRERGTDMSVFSGAVVHALQEMGLPASASGRNDILIDGKKVSGTAQRIVKVDGRERILYHGTLLFRSDPDMIAGALRPDPLKFASKSTKSVRSRVGNISDFLPEGTTLSAFWEKLREVLLVSASDGEEPIINQTEILELKTKKYDTYEWNYGRSPVFSYQNRKRFAGGTLDVRLNIGKGIITGALISGDFLSLRPASEIAERLLGVKYEEEAIAGALEGYCLQDYLGGITKEEFLSVVCSF